MLTARLRQGLRRLFVRQPQRQTQVLIAATRAIVDLPDSGQLMTTVLAQLDMVVPSSSSAIHLIEGDVQRLVVSRRLPETGPPIGTCWPRAQMALTSAVAAQRAPLIVQDVRSDARWQELRSLSYVRAWMGLPLLAHDEVLGFLMLDRDEPYSFRAEEAEIAMAFASQLAVGLRLARLATDNQRQLAELSALYALSRTASTALESDELLSLLADHLEMIVGADFCTIMLLDEDGGFKLAATTQRAQSPSDLSKFRLTPDQPSLAQEVLRLRAPFALADASAATPADQHLHTVFGVRSLLGVPLFAQGSAIGAVLFGHVQAQHSFGVETVKRAEVAAGHAALAITNARLFNDTRRHARALALRDQVRMAIAAAPPEVSALAHYVTSSLAQTFGYLFADCWEVQGERLVLLSSATNFVGEIALGLDHGICAWVARHGQPRLVRNVQQADDYLQPIAPATAELNQEEERRSHLIVSEVCVPVFDGERVALVLNVEHNQELGRQDLQMLTDIAAQVGLALEHVRLIGEMQRVHEDLGRAARMAAVGTLAAGVAHEFNNMLAAMVGYAQLGLSGSLEEKIEALRTVELIARRGKYVTTSLLAFAEGDMAQRTQARLCDLAEQALRLVEQDLHTLGINTQRHYDERVRVLVDQPQLVQAIIHLLTNARDAMVTGGLLTLSISSNDSWAELSITDTGAGIPESVRDRLFEPFVTTKGALGGSTLSGIGLGLSICYGIVVQRHGGLIEWHSDQGHGSTFKLMLPALAAEPASTQVHPAAGEAGLSSLRVLVVDDDTVIQALLRAMLTRAGFVVSLAADVEGARALLRRGDHDVVLCDLGLPGADGVQLVEQLRDSGSTIPVVLMTGRVDSAAHQRLRSAPAAGVLTKPFQMHEVLQALQQATQGKERWGVGAG